MTTADTYYYVKALFLPASCWIDKLFYSIFLKGALHLLEGLSWLWLYDSWIYNYLCNQCLSPLMLWIRISIRARCTTLCDKVCQWLAIGRWFSPGPPVTSTNKTDCHDITEILLKVALNTIIFFIKNIHLLVMDGSGYEDYIVHVQGFL